MRPAGGPTLETVSSAAAPCGRMTLWHKMAILADDQLAEPADHGGDPDVALLQVLRPDGAVFAADPLLARASRVRGSLSRMLECVYPTWVRANLTASRCSACAWVVHACVCRCARQNLRGPREAELTSPPSRCPYSISRSRSHASRRHSGESPGRRPAPFKGRRRSAARGGSPYTSLTYYAFTPRASLNLVLIILKTS
jgi:hypothetical protein